MSSALGLDLDQKAELERRLVDVLKKLRESMKENRTNSKVTRGKYKLIDWEATSRFDLEAVFELLRQRKPDTWPALEQRALELHNIFTQYDTSYCLAWKDEKQIIRPNNLNPVKKSFFNDPPQTHDMTFQDQKISEQDQETSLGLVSNRQNQNIERENELKITLNRTSDQKQNLESERINQYRRLRLLKLEDAIIFKDILAHLTLHTPLKGRPFIRLWIMKMIPVISS